MTIKSKGSKKSLRIQIFNEERNVLGQRRNRNMNIAASRSHPLIFFKETPQKVTAAKVEKYTPGNKRT